MFSRRQRSHRPRGYRLRGSMVSDRPHEPWRRSVRPLHGGAWSFRSWRRPVITWTVLKRRQERYAGGEATQRWPSNRHQSGALEPVFRPTKWSESSGVPAVYAPAFVFGNLSTDVDASQGSRRRMSNLYQVRIGPDQADGLLRRSHRVVPVSGLSVELQRCKPWPPKTHERVVATSRKEPGHEAILRRQFGGERVKQDEAMRGLHRCPLNPPKVRCLVVPRTKRPILGRRPSASIGPRCHHRQRHLCLRLASWPFPTSAVHRPLRGGASPPLPGSQGLRKNCPVRR